MRPLTSLVTFFVAVVAAGCASSGAVPHPFPTVTAVVTSAPPVEEIGTPAPVDKPAVLVARTAGRGADLVEAALELRGAPYRSGGQDPRGFDCSGLVWYVFTRGGISVPRTVATQFQTGKAVKEQDLQPGDLVFFETGVSPASHVGVAIGGGDFVHAPSSRGEVRVERLASPYWAKHFVGARRLL